MTSLMNVLRPESYAFIKSVLVSRKESELPVIDGLLRFNHLTALVARYKRCGTKGVSEPFFGIRGLPWGRVVISRPSFFVAVVVQVSSPNGEPRLTLRRSAVSSASV
jgi:hypothetical protein